MNENMLKVMNEVHKLGLTKEHWKQIKEERRLPNKRSIKIIKVKRTRKYGKDYYVCVCVDHAEKKDLVVREIEAPGSQQDSRWRRPQEGDQIIFNALVPSGIEIPQALHELQYISGINDSRRYNLEYVADTKERLIQIFSESINGWKKLGTYDDSGYVVDENDRMQGAETYKRAENKRIEFQNRQLQSIFNLFGEEFKEIDTSKIRFNIGMIVKVFQVKNRRLAVMVEKESYHDVKERGLFKMHYKVDRVVYFLMGFTPNNPQYNYVAPGRELIINNNIEVYVDDDLKGQIDSNDLYGYTAMVARERDRINNEDDEKFILMTADKYMVNRRKIKRHLLDMNTKEADKSAEKLLEENIKKAFDKGQVVRHGITFKPRSIEYERIKITGPGISKFCIKENILLQETPDIVSIWEAYVEYAVGMKWDYNYYPNSYSLDKGEVRFKMGKIKLHVKFKGRKQYWVNGFSIHGEDVPEICKIAIRFKTQKEFDEYLVFSSEYNLYIQNWFKKGLITFEIPTKSDDCDLQLDDKVKAAIPVELDENKKMVITIGKNKYHVKNKASLINLTKGEYNYRYQSSIQSMVSQLFKAISKIKETDVALLLKEGVKRYTKSVAEQRRIDKEKTDKSKEFVAHAVKISKAEKVRGGYLVRGKSKTMYFVEDELRVYTCKPGKKTEWINDQYLCLIDVGSDTNTAWGKNDAIAKRLLMLKEDLVLASDIYYKGDQMDKHWLDLMREVEG